MIDLKNKDNRKTLLRICVNFVILFAIYQVILYIGERYISVYKVGISLYLLTASVLFCVFYAKNGYKLSGALTNKDDLPEEWTEYEKDAYLSEEKKKKKQARKALTFLLPMIVTILINCVALYALNLFR